MMTIKSCNLQDVPALVKVSIQAYRDHYTHLWFDDGVKYVGDNFNPEVFRSQLEEKNVALYLIHDDTNKPAGFLKLNLDKALENYNAADSLELERIYLRKSASGKGIGKEVLQFVTKVARERNKKYIWLKSMDSGPALGFYKHEGFRIVGQTTLTFPEMKPELRGMYIMVKEI